MTSNGVQSPHILFVQEKDLNCRTTQADMSQGMFRALSLLISINFAARTGSAECILIDDIGEGLDFARSAALLDCIIKKNRKPSFQIIMTTNDRFIMNSVPLKHWIILDRHGSDVQSVTARNSPKIFEEFDYLGLSNFDFFSRDLFRSLQSARSKHGRRKI